MSSNLRDRVLEKHMPRVNEERITCTCGANLGIVKQHRFVFPLVEAVTFIFAQHLLALPELSELPATKSADEIVEACANVRSPNLIYGGTNGLDAASQDAIRALKGKFTLAAAPGASAVAKLEKLSAQPVAREEGTK